MKPEEFIKQLNELVKKGSDAIDYGAAKLDDTYKVENAFTDIKKLAEKFVASLLKVVYAVIEPPEPEDYQDNDPTVTLYADHKTAQDELAKKAIAVIDDAAEINNISIDTGDDGGDEVDVDEAKELLAKGTDYCAIDQFDFTYTLQVKTLTIH